MTKQLRILIVFFVLILQSSLFAGELENQTIKVWELYANNKETEAKAICDKLLEQYPTDTNLLMLSIDIDIAENASGYENSLLRLLKLVNNPNPYVDAYFYVWQLRSLDYKKIKSQIETLNEILENPKLDVTSLGTLNIELARRYTQIKDLDNTVSTYAKIGSLSKWELLGPFNNLVGIGFDKDEEILKHPEHFTFTGQYGSKITWYEYKNSYDGEWVYLDNYNASNNSIVFAQTFLKSESDRDLTLDIGFSGSIKIYVNDALVLKEQKEKNNGTDAYTTQIRLNKGYNRILVQVGQSENKSSNFLIRLKESDGSLAKGLTAIAEAKEYTKSKSNPLFGKAKNLYLGFFANLINTSSYMKDYFTHKYAKYCITFENYENSLEIAEKLSAKYPKSILLMSLISEYYMRQKNTTKQNEIVKVIQTLDSNTYAYFSYQLGQYYSKEDYSGCLELIEKSKHLITEELYYGMLIELYAKEKKEEKAIELVDIAYNKYPYNSSFISYKVLVENSRTSDIRNILKLISNVTDKVVDLELTKIYCGLLMKNNEYDDLFKHLKKEEKFFFGYATFNVYVAEIYQNKQMLDKAEEYYKKVLEYCPNYSSIHAYIADINSTNNKEKAKDCYYKSLAAYPYEYEVIRKLRDIEDKPTIYSLFGEEDYYKLFTDFKENSTDNNNINYILDEDQVVVYGSGASERKHILVAKVLTEKGIDDLKEFYVSSYSNEETVIEKAEVVKSNGNKIPAEVNNSEIVFPNLKIGDGVIVIYRIKHYPLPGLSNQFFHNKMFQNSEWTAKSKLKLLIDSDYKFNFKKIGENVTMHTSQVENFKLYTWEKTDIPKYVYEEAVPNVYDIADIVHISSIANWGEINNWYKKISNVNNEDDLFIDRKIAEIFPDGYQKYTELERAKILYNFIVKNVRYSSVSFRNSGLIPQKPSEVLSTSLGDCKDVSLLYKTLGEKVKLNINLILVATKDYGARQLELPSINFNHCMALLRINNKKYFVELTSDFNGFNVLAPGTIGSPYFEIGDNVDERIGIIESETRQRNVIKRLTEISFKNENMTVSKNYTMYGNAASDIRQNLKNKSKKENDDFFSGYMPPLYANKELIDYKYDDLSDLNKDSLKYSFSYNVESPFSSIGNMQIFRPPFSLSKEDLSFVTKKERNFPFCLWHVKFDFDNEEETITLNYPEGKTISEIPKDVLIDNEIFKYHLRYVKEENACKIIRSSFVKIQTVPVDKYAILTSSIKKMVEAEKVQLAFVDYIKPLPTKKSRK